MHIITARCSVVCDELAGGRDVGVSASTVHFSFGKLLMVSSPRMRGRAAHRTSRVHGTGQARYQSDAYPMDHAVGRPQPERAIFLGLQNAKTAERVIRGRCGVARRRVEHEHES